MGAGLKGMAHERSRRRRAAALGCAALGLYGGADHGSHGRMPLRQHPCAPAALEASGGHSGANLYLLILPQPQSRMISDPAGLLELSADDWSLVELYRFGTRTADFVICRRCGVFIAAISDLSTKPYAVVNVNCLDDRALFTAQEAMHEFQDETLEARTSRRTANWMPAVVQR
jgi:hypothetical protein